MSKTIKSIFIILFSLTLIGCQTGTSSATPNIDTSNSVEEQATGNSIPVTDVPLELFAQLSEGSGVVEIRVAEMGDFKKAEVLDIINVMDQLRTGIDGRAKLDLSDQTIIRIGPSSTFTLIELAGQSDQTESTLALLAGKLWAALKGASITIDTPSGLITVRGSYIGVEVSEGGSGVSVNCFEGDCTAKNNAGAIGLIAGQSVSMPDADTITAVEPISQDAMEEWQRENPESETIIPVITQTVEAWMALTPTVPTRPASGTGGDSSSGSGGIADGGELVLKMVDVNGTSVNVPNTTNVILRFGWGATTEALVNEFFNIATITYTMDGEILPDSGGYFGDMETTTTPEGIPIFYNNYFYDLGTLRPGTYTVGVIVPEHAPIIDGIDADGDGVFEEFRGPYNFSFTLVVGN